ncbi:MAG: exodeoxyribonuclease VII small subunit [Gammaproteobacteria bacterium]|nr:exodeoxyribonuclease VII small subunit [Gammaproteobacteria bacterium]
MTKKQPETKPASSSNEQEDNNFNFESSLNELEKLVDALENGDLSLEQSLQDFERGINLTRACQSALTDAQQKVQILLQQDNKSSLEAYSDNESNTSESSESSDKDRR